MKTTSQQPTHDDMCEAEFGFMKARYLVYKYGVVLMESYFESSGTNNDEDVITSQCKVLEDEIMNLLPKMNMGKNVQPYKNDVLNFLRKARKTEPMYCAKYLKMAQNSLEDLHNFYKGVSSMFYNFLDKN